MIQQGIFHTLLVIARSARMLVQLATVAGFKVVAIDCFADEDTRQMAVEMIRVQSLDLQNVQPVVRSIGSKCGLTHVVYGSGFEQHTDTLAYLQNNFVVLGNSVEVFRQFQDKSAFFAGLTRLGIPYPETIFSPPIEVGCHKSQNVGWVERSETQQIQNDGVQRILPFTTPSKEEVWLVKPMCGEGGADIALYGPDSPSEMGEWYWQRYLPGEPMSVLFLAGDGQIKPLGFNRQWSAAIDAKHPMLFAGVISLADLSLLNRQLLSDWLTKLLKIYPLQGLGSLDFMLVDGRCYVLELNPRIPASAQLYGDSIFAMHVEACLGELDGSVLAAEPQGYQVIYAKNPLTIADQIQWPDWAVDRPSAGSFIGKGEPLCSIIAAGKTAEQVAECLRQRQNFIEKLFKTGL